MKTNFGRNLLGSLGWVFIPSIVALVSIYESISRDYGTYNYKKWSEIYQQRQIERIKNIKDKFYEIDSDSSGIIDSTEYLDFYLGKREVVKDSLFKNMTSVKIYDNRTEVSGGRIPGDPRRPFLLVDYENDGILDKKTIYFPCPRYGSGGPIQTEISEKDQEFYSKLRN
ncbi:hypothetical protein ISS08_00875 [Candidatus Pacearchaeota archaeon]|nr:hypothetical protein [Candidatus Pacearchaeota archaeon]